MTASVKKFTILSPLSQRACDSFRITPVSAGGVKVDGK
jgi:hypothetical protein